MITNHVIRKIAAALRAEEPVDVYHVVDDLKSEFPEFPREALLEIVNQEIIKSRATAVWQQEEAIRPVRTPCRK